MKSKKATEAIERYRKEFTAGFVTQNEIERVNEHCRLFTEVVEIAESDRDAKAVEAFRSTVEDLRNKEDVFELFDNTEFWVEIFIQKLNEE